MAKKPSFKKRDEERGKSLKDYWPLVALILVSALAGAAMQWGMEGKLLQWMHYFMGFFLCTFALLKLFHPLAFADGFQMYDLLAKRARIYAYIYPLIELAIGLALFSFFVPILTYIVTIIVMLFGATGVIHALTKGLDVKCACMGSMLDVPLSTVTLVEDFGMAILSFIMFFMHG